MVHTQQKSTRHLPGEESPPAMGPAVLSVPSADLQLDWSGSPSHSRLKRCLSPVPHFLLLNVRVGDTNFGPSGKEIHRVKPETWLKGGVVATKSAMCSCVLSQDSPPTLPPLEESLLTIP